MEHNEYVTRLLYRMLLLRMKWTIFCMKNKNLPSGIGVSVCIIKDVCMHVCMYSLWNPVPMFMQSTHTLHVYYCILAAHFVCALYFSVFHWDSSSFAGTVEGRRNWWCVVSRVFLQLTLRCYGLQRNLSFSYIIRSTNPLMNILLMYNSFTYYRTYVYNRLCSCILTAEQKLDINCIMR